MIVFVALVACASPLAAVLRDSYSGRGDTDVRADPKPLESTWFVSRKQWLAQEPKSVCLLQNPQRRVIVTHTETRECHNRDSCAAVVRSIQKKHMTDMAPGEELDDIGYNFLVGGDGRVYEGRGWGVKGAHTSTCNTNCLGVAFIGDYRSKNANSKPTADQVKYMQRLLDIGERNGHLISTYAIIPKCQAKVTDSPGDNLFNVMVNWPRYSATDGDFKKVCHLD